MPTVNRRVTYKLCPSPSQAAALEHACDLHRALYNAALEERIEAYRKAGVSVSFADQCKSLTVVRRECPEYLALNAQSAQVRKWMAKRHRKVANRRKDFLHQTTARLVRGHSLIVTEDLTVANMTASAKGTKEKPGKMEPLAE
jgi:transposase